MKIVINTCYGGFGINSKWGMKNCEDCEEDCHEDLRKCRRCAKLIRALKEREEQVGNYFSKLSVVEIPDEATDYQILDCEGCELLLYVLDGKIKYVNVYDT